MKPSFLPPLYELAKTFLKSSMRALEHTVPSFWGRYLSAKHLILCHLSPPRSPDIQTLKEQPGLITPAADEFLPLQYEKPKPFPMQFSLEFNSPLTGISFWSPTSHTMHLVMNPGYSLKRELHSVLSSMFSKSVTGSLWKCTLLVLSAWLTHHRLYFEGTIPGNLNCKKRCECSSTYLTAIADPKMQRLHTSTMKIQWGVVWCVHIKIQPLLKTEALRAGL